MRRRIGRLLERYGQTAVLRRSGGDTAVRAFLQPLCRQEERFPSAMTPSGALDERVWLYLGVTAVEPGDRLVWNGETYRVRSSRERHLGDTALYWQAFLVRTKERTG